MLRLRLVWPTYDITCVTYQFTVGWDVVVSGGNMLSII